MSPTLPTEGSMPALASRSVYLIETYCPSSSGRRNACLSRSQQLVKCLGGGSPDQGLARSGIKRRSHGREGVRAVHTQVSALREVLPQQPIGILVGAALPRAVRIAEVDLHTSIDQQLRVLAHFRPLIPGQRSSQLLR